MDLPAYVIPSSSRKMEAAVRYPAIQGLSGVGLGDVGNLGDDALAWIGSRVGPGSGKWIAYAAGGVFLLLVLWMVKTPGGYREKR